MTAKKLEVYVNKNGYIRNLMSAIFAVVVAAPVTWMVLDRDPPYIRLTGEIEAADPDHCELLPDAPRGISPGACVSVFWTVRPVRNCKPDHPFNVVRSITDRQGRRHILPSVTSKWDIKSFPDEIKRYIVLPLTASIGPATYQASVSYACNFLQFYLLPILIDTPDLQFIIEPPRKAAHDK